MGEENTINTKQTLTQEQILEKIKRKVIKEEDGTLFIKYTRPQFQQKYFSQPEIDMIKAAGEKDDPWAEKLRKLVGAKEKPPKGEKRPHKPREKENARPQKFGRTARERGESGEPKGATYVYEDGEEFHSAHELYFWIWCKENGIKIQKNWKKFIPLGEGVPPLFPTFIVNGIELVCVIGSRMRETASWKRTSEALKRSGKDAEVTIMFSDEERMKSFRAYVWEKHGTEYVKRFRVNKPKRAVIVIPSGAKRSDVADLIFERRNDGGGTKVEYRCKKCGKLVYTSIRTFSTIGMEPLCKACRKKRAKTKQRGEKEDISLKSGSAVEHVVEEF